MLKHEHTTSTPLPITFKYDPLELERMNAQQKFPVREIIGAVSYVALCTR